MIIGLKINFAKSQTNGVGYEGDLHQFSSLPGYYSGSLLTTYLGLSLGDKYKGIAKRDKVIDKRIYRLAGQHKPLLTRVGKITLINSVLAFPHTFCLYLKCRFMLLRRLKS